MAAGPVQGAISTVSEKAVLSLIDPALIVVICMAPERLLKGLCPGFYSRVPARVPRRLDHHGPKTGADIPPQHVVRA